MRWPRRCCARRAPTAHRGGECGACDICRRVKRKKHPDVRYFAPEGAGGYLVDQIRDIAADTVLAPIQADRKIYILDRVDLLGVQAANAFLKTLEEPPSDVVLILLGRTRESVLPTILSRCQVVPFRHIPASEAAGILAQNTGARLREKARIAIEACDGSITRGIEFLKSNERLAFRARVLEALALLRNADDWDLVGQAGELVVLAKAPLDVVRAAQEEELAENADFLAKSAIRQIEARNKRQLTAKSLESLRQLTAIIRSWLRDVLAVCAETPELVIERGRPRRDTRTPHAPPTRPAWPPRFRPCAAATRPSRIMVSPEDMHRRAALRNKGRVYRPRPPAGAGAVR